MSDWVQRIRDEGKKLEQKLEVVIAEVEQHLSAAEGVDTVDLEAAENRDDAERAVEEAANTPPEKKTSSPGAAAVTPAAAAVTPEAETVTPEAETTPPETESTPPKGSGSTKTPNA